MGRGTASPTGRSLSALHLMQRQTGHASSNRQFVASIGAQLPWHAPLEMHNGLLACPATTGADNAIGRRPARAQRRVYARALPTQLVRGSPCPSAFNVPVAQQHGNRSLMPLTAHPSAGRRPQKTAPTRVARTTPTGVAKRPHDRAMRNRSGR